jgi:RND family efflux transporter MFP subunit
MTTRKFLTSFLIIGAAHLLAGCSDKMDNTSLKNLPVKVQVQKAEKSNGNDAFAYSGTIEESESIPLSFTVLGSIVRVNVSEGDYVRKGTLLAKLNNVTYKNTYEMSYAALKQAEDAYNRLLPMYKNGNLPEIKLVEVETGLQQAKSAAAIAKKNVDDCYLYSPTEGIVGKRSIESGMNVIPGLAAITIVKIEKVFAKIAVSENEIASIKKGQEAIIKIGALNNHEFKGTVEEVGVLADLLAHTYKVKILIPNKDQLIKPGMICSVTIPKTKTDDRIVIPNQSVQVDEKGKTYVYSVDKSQTKAFRTYVKTGKLLKNGIEIETGLNIGDLVVVSGQQKLIDNSLIHIVN